MTREEIIRMARDAGSIDSEEVIETVWRTLSAAEREACAKVCEELRDDWLPAADFCAEAIRARGHA